MAMSDPPPLLASPVATALALSIASVIPHLILPRAASLAFAAVLLGVIAGVYFGFAVMKGALRDQLVELIVSCLFALAAILGLTASPIFLPAAYVAHAFWDFAHHNRSNLRLVAVPQWYVPWCASIDVIIAAGLCLVWLHTGVL
jgi:hypothetical protein